MNQDMNDPHYRLMRDSGDPDYWKTDEDDRNDREKFREMETKERKEK